MTTPSLNFIDPKIEISRSQNRCTCEVINRGDMVRKLNETRAHWFQVKQELVTLESQLKQLCARIRMGEDTENRHPNSDALELTRLRME
jgi:hypothetical protein